MVFAMNLSKLYSKTLPLLNNIIPNKSFQITRNMCNLKYKNRTDVFISICVERHPIISPPLSEIEQKYLDMITQIEYENSLKSNHELRKERDLSKETKKITDDFGSELRIEQTAEEFEDECIEEFKTLKFASRTTEADEKNITTSLNRKLDKSLFLVTRQNIQDSDCWMLPLSHIKQGESLREAAERTLKSICGENLNVKWYGNVPIAFTKRIFKNEEQSVRVFYFLAKYLNGSVTNSEKYQWLDDDELKNTMPEYTYNQLSHLFQVTK